MRTKYLVIVGVTIISVLAAVAITGIPSSSSTDLDDVPPPVSATTTASTSAPSTSTSSPAPSEDPDAPVTDPSAPDTEPPATDPAATDPPPTDPSDTELEPARVDRAALEVVVVNGAGFAGVARETSDELIVLGYEDVRTTDGAEIVEATGVYAKPGLETEAERLATDLGIDSSFVFPLSATPEIINPVDADMIVYLGIDIDER